MATQSTESRKQALNSIAKSLNAPELADNPLWALGDIGLVLIEIAESLQTVADVLDNWNRNAVSIENIHE